MKDYAQNELYQLENSPDSHTPQVIQRINNLKAQLANSSKEIRNINAIQKDFTDVGSMGSIKASQSSPLGSSPVTANGPRSMNIQLILKEKDKEIQKYSQELSVLKAQYNKMFDKQNK